MHKRLGLFDLLPLLITTNGATTAWSGKNGVLKLPLCWVLALGCSSEGVRGTIPSPEVSHKAWRTLAPLSTHWPQHFSFIKDQKESTQRLKYLSSLQILWCVTFSSAVTKALDSPLLRGKANLGNHLCSNLNLLIGDDNLLFRVVVMVYWDNE